MNARILTKFNETVFSPNVNPHTNMYDGRWWKCICNIRYEVNGEVHTIEAGYLTDFGSIPKLARVFIDRSDETLLAFVFHDYCYGKGKMKLSRKEADMAMRSIALDCGQDKFEINATYYSVRAFGKSKFKVHHNFFSPVDAMVVHNVCADNGYECTEIK